MGFTPSARMLARRHNVDVASLIDILSHCRPYPSAGEEEFIEKYLDGIDGMVKDAIGNRYIAVPNPDGSKSNVMWSCHTDTVHGSKNDGRQNIRWDADGNILGLNDPAIGFCLGADDGAGMWLMLEMLKVGKPGLYIFHRGEEKGGVGSRWLVKNTPEVVDGIDYAIAFDRMDLNSVITFQGGQRCCSDKFGLALAEALGPNFKLDQGGSFTDTKVYTDLVAECTNVSVGYYSQHGPRETLDVRHMLKLREALLKMDPSSLPVERKPGDNESRWPTYGGYYGSSNYSSPAKRQADAYQRAWGGEDAAYEEWLRHNTPKTAVPIENKEEDAAKLLRMVEKFPEVIVKILQHYDVDQYDIADLVLGLAGIDGSTDGLLAAMDAADDDGDDPQSEVRVHCKMCDANIDPVDIDTDMRCPYCYADVRAEFEDALAAEDAIIVEKIESERAEA